MFSCEYSKIFKDSLFCRTPLVATCENFMRFYSTAVLQDYSRRLLLFYSWLKGFVYIFEKHITFLYKNIM